MAEIPIACSLNANDLAARMEELKGIGRKVIERVKINNGLSLRFKLEPGLLQELAGVIEREHECCRSLSFVLAVEAGSDMVRLDVTGAGARSVEP